MAAISSGDGASKYLGFTFFFGHDGAFQVNEKNGGSIPSDWLGYVESSMLLLTK